MYYMSLRCRKASILCIWEHMQSLDINCWVLKKYLFDTLLIPVSWKFVLSCVRSSCDKGLFRACPCISPFHKGVRTFVPCMCKPSAHVFLLGMWALNPSSPKPWQFRLTIRTWWRIFTTWTCTRMADAFMRRCARFLETFPVTRRTNTYKKETRRRTRMLKCLYKEERCMVSRNLPRHETHKYTQARDNNMHT